MANVGNVLSDEAIRDIAAINRDFRGRDHSRRGRRGTIRGLSRQAIIEALLIEDLSSADATPAAAYLIKRTTGGELVPTDREIDIFGDCDLNSELGDPLLAPRAGCRVICAWLGGVWRALRRSGGCCSSSSSSSSSSDSSSSSSSSDSSSESSSESSSPSSSSDSESSESSESTPSESSTSSESSESSTSSESSEPSASSESGSSEPSDPSGSSDGSCVEVLKDISFNTDTCTLTKTFVDVKKC